MGLFEEVFDITTSALGKKYKTCPGCNKQISIYHNQTSCNNARLDRRRCKNCGDKIIRGTGRKIYCSSSCADEKKIKYPGLKEVEQFERDNNFNETGFSETNTMRSYTKIVVDSETGYRILNNREDLANYEHREILETGIKIKCGKCKNIFIMSRSLLQIEFVNCPSCKTKNKINWNKNTLNL